MNLQSQRSFIQDHDVGKAKERLSYPMLKKYVKGFSKYKLIHELDNFAPWDFTSPDVMIEHKSVNYNLSEMKEVMINSHKVWRSPIEKANGKRCFFAFRALDGLYVIEYNTKQFKGYREEEMLLPDRPDYTEKMEDKLYIPVSDLFLLQKFELNFVSEE